MTEVLIVRASRRTAFIKECRLFGIVLTLMAIYYYVSGDTESIRALPIIIGGGIIFFALEIAAEHFGASIKHYNLELTPEGLTGPVAVNIFDETSELH